MCYKKSLNNALHYSNILPCELRRWRREGGDIKFWVSNISDDFEAAFYLKFMVIKLFSPQIISIVWLRDSV